MPDQPGESVGLHRPECFLGRQDDRFVFLELGGEVAGRVGERLLRDVVGRQRLAHFATGQAVAFGGGEGGGGDLQVVAEDPVVADLQCADAGALALRAFEVGDPHPRFAGSRLVPVELRGMAWLEDHAPPEDGRRLLDEGGVQQLVHGSAIGRFAAAGQVTGNVADAGNPA